MSRRNAQIVADAMERLNQAGEPDWGLYDAELIWQTRSDGPGHLTYEGLDGLRQGLDSLREAWARFSGEIVEQIERGDVVVSVIRWDLEAQSGVRLQTVEAWVSWLRGGKIVRIEQHGTKASALEAAGLAQ